MPEITVEGRKFSVEKTENGDYILTGVRGARYRTMRNVNRTHMMFLINLNGWAKHAPQCWLSDKDGTLKVRP